MSQQPVHQLKKYWGYESFRPLQQETIECVLSGRDSLTVLPTGGGKSICFQLPSLCSDDGLAVVISPLISLMKDQVDGLVSNGIAAGSLNSTQSSQQQATVVSDAEQGKLRLLYVSPERLVQETTVAFLKRVGVRYFAIDEAHCISSWGHDFRPEYRQLRTLNQTYPGCSVHAFTATATPRVRGDIIEQLQLEGPEVFVGSFHRPNLTYRVVRRGDVLEQMRQIIDRYPGQSGIIYCISRKEVESVASVLSDLGLSAHPYHAGMSAADRERNQDDFIHERVDIIVATVAFGMGIDKSCVRYVIHNGMPKSLEAYQQESGRAGRDGLPSECCLLYSGSDLMMWKRMGDGDPGSKLLLEAMNGYCTRTVCRHRMLVEYFGQQFETHDCQACDICLSERELVKEPLVLAQKVLSCVYRVEQRFGVSHVAAVLRGSTSKRVRELGHDKLSTFGLLADFSKSAVTDWVEQLVSQDCLARTGEYNVLKITALGTQVLRGEQTPKLYEPDVAVAKPQSNLQSQLSEEEAGLFDALRMYRREVAAERNLSPFLIFHDACLRDLSRIRPSTLDGFGRIPGVGEKKSQDLGPGFLERITKYAAENKLPMDVDVHAKGRPMSGGKTKERAVNVQKKLAFELFGQGQSLESVAKQVDRAPSTTRGYLREYLQIHGITDPTPWVPNGRADAIRKAAEDVASLEKLTPIREVLGEEYSFEEISIVVECLRIETGFAPTT